jgi:hypothetical protein
MSGILQKGFNARLSGAAAFTALARLRIGWPHELIAAPTASATPLVTVFVPNRYRLSSEPARIEVQTDIWEWPEPTAAKTRGLVKVDAIDEVMQELLGEEDGSAVSWQYTPPGGDPVIITCACMEGSDPPEKGLLRRRRLWEVAFG